MKSQIQELVQKFNENRDSLYTLYANKFVVFNKDGVVFDGFSISECVDYIKESKLIAGEYAIKQCTEYEIPATFLNSYFNYAS